jgi:hypothetical protein
MVLMMHDTCAVSMINETSGVPTIHETFTARGRFYLISVIANLTVDL